MLWYVAFVAMLNLGLGYAWGAYLRPCPRCAKARSMGLSLLPPTSASEFDARIEPLELRSGAIPPVTVPPMIRPIGALALDAETGLVTREQAELLLQSLSAADSSGQELTVALVEMAPLDGVVPGAAAGVVKRLLRGVSNIVRESLAADHTVAQYAEQQILLVVPNEGVDQVAKRAEELRQRVATTEFMADGHAYQTTVTCALAAAANGQMGPRLFDFLKEALDEAKRYGGNRTFTHDGKSPSPVVPAELPIAAQQLAI